MRKYDLITPEGTKDFLFEECYVRREIEQNLHDLFHSKGYSELTTPGLEFFDVFQSESGHYPQERLYKLTDSKGRLLVLPSGIYHADCTRHSNPSARCIITAATVLYSVSVSL